MNEKLDHKATGVADDAEANLKGTPASSGKPGEAMGMPAVFQLKKILVPVDFSNCSKKALQYAIPFARQFGAELTLLHVLEPAVALPTADGLATVITESTADVQSGLDELRGAVGGDIPASTLVRAGSPHMEIIAAAAALDIDMIILSTHGRTGLSHVLLGGTAEKVVRRAGCPVLVVREHEHEFINVASVSS